MGLIRFFKDARVYVATIFLSITLVSIIIGNFALFLFLAVLVSAGTFELSTFAKAKGMKLPLWLVLGVNILLLGLATIGKTEYIGLVLTFAVIASFLIILFRGKNASVNDLTYTIMVLMYGGWLPIHLILLRNLNHNGINLFGFHPKEGLGYIILIFFVISLSDIMAYYVGKKFGKTPLMPEISPKKTREGSIGGTIGGVLGAVLVGYFIGLPVYHSLISGLILSITSQYGDLSESMLKRDAGVKDSGNVLPGHGGVLDRADSYIFTGAVAYYYFSIFVIGKLSLFTIL